MLQNILNQIREFGGTVSLDELSRKLGVETSALEGMLDYCVRKGILRESQDFPEGADCDSIGGGCGSSCKGFHGCPLIARMPKTYELQKRKAGER